MTETGPESAVYDYIVVGGGMAGMMAASRIHALRPEARILLLEKEPELGGRARTFHARESGVTYGYGLSAVSSELYDFLEQTLKASDPDYSAPDDVVSCKYTEIGVLQAGKVKAFPVDQWFTAKGARALGGLAASRQFPEFAEAIKGEDSVDKPFAQLWKKNRKAPIAIVMEHYGAAYGISDIWNASASGIQERGQYYSKDLRCGAWSRAFEAFDTHETVSKSTITVVRDAMVLESHFEADVWTLETVKGEYQGKRLICAVPPWQAVGWLPKDVCPPELVSVANKTKPTSAVILSERLNHVDSEEKITLPQVTMVPAERVQIVNNGDGSVNFQATIDFEVSLQAPDVLKAVRRLKRARAKLLAVYPGIVTEGNHIALQPYAWTAPTAARDTRYFEKLGREKFQSSTLAFCGDAYGPHGNGDKNLIESLVNACNAVSEG